MNSFLVVLLAAGACSSSVLRVGNTMPALTQRRGTVELPRGSVSYDVKMVPEEAIIDLSTIRGIKHITCNVAKTGLLLSFDTSFHCKQFANTVSLTTFTFIVGGKTFGNICVLAELDDSVSIRRIVGGSLNSNTLELTTVETHYEELFEDASIQLNSSSSSSRVSAVGAEADKSICVGYNTVPGSDCASPAQPIDLYKNKYLDATCEDCFLGFHMDVFVDITIKGFKLESVSGGFRDMTIDTALVVKAASLVPQYAVGIDKVLKLFAEAPVLDFHIGSVPFKITFDTPVEVKADAQIHSQAVAQAGMTGKLSLGDVSMSWTPTNGWKEQRLSPEFVPTPIVSGSASFQGDVSLKVVASCIMTVGKVFTYGITFTPTATSTIAGSASSKKICVDVNSELTVTHFAQFDINVNWHFIHENFSRHFGPKTIYSDLEQLPQKCVSA